MTVKLILITDVHANFPALQAASDAIQQEGYDALVFLGDAIAIGPFPTETVELLLSLPELHCVMGNHDEYFVDGLPTPQPKWMSDGEREHQLWTHAQLSAETRTLMSQWPYRLDWQIEGVTMAFTHYGIDPLRNKFKRPIHHPTPELLDGLFAGVSAEFIAYGHHHPFSDVQGVSRYFNPGSLGCHTEAVASYAVVTVRDGQIAIQNKAVAYDDAPLIAAYAERDVPERENIAKFFFGSRF